MKPQPHRLTDDELRDMHRDGEQLSDIFHIAYKYRRLGRQQVREILFGAPR